MGAMLCESGVCVCDTPNQWGGSVCNENAGAGDFLVFGGPKASVTASTLDPERADLR